MPWTGVHDLEDSILPPGMESAQGQRKTAAGPRVRGTRLTLFLMLIGEIEEMGERYLAIGTAYHILHHSSNQQNHGRRLGW